MRNVEKTTKTIVNNTATSTGAYTPRIQKRSVASQDISWNGRPETFPVLKERVEGHFIQSLMGHMVLRKPFNPSTAAASIAATPAQVPTDASSVAAPQHFGKPLTKQYGATPEKKANLSFKDPVTEGQTRADSESDGDPEVLTDFEKLQEAFMEQRNVCISQTEFEDIPTVQANTNYIERMIGLVQGNDSSFLAVTDNGADTTVMGDGWLILGDPERAPRANLVGFDKEAKNKGLPIISGAIKVRLDNDEFIILRVHQGVYNSGSRTTLISEFQVREHGLILDSVSSTHRAHVDGDKGTQAFWLSTNQKLPLKLKGGLMTFAFSKPSWEDMEQLEVVDITNEMPWHPVMHSDDPLQIRSMNENAAFQTVKKDPPASKGGDTSFDSETFHDAIPFPESMYSSDSFCCARNEGDEQKMFFFDPSDISERGQFGKAFHLTIDYDAFMTNKEEPHIFVRDSMVDGLLMNLTDEEIMGRNTSFDSYAYAIRAVHRFKEAELELIQPYLGFRPLEVI
jgi:hypothetical protein